MNTITINNHIYQRISKDAAHKLFDQNGAILITYDDTDYDEMMRTIDIIDNYFGGLDFNKCVSRYIAKQHKDGYPSFYIIAKNA